MKKSKGKFIAFEGIDGSGKTTQILLLHSWLTKNGYKVLLTEEPTRELLTGYFVKILLRTKDKYPTLTYPVMFLVDRLAHIEKQIKPALDEGKVVVTDRYHFSTLAYQTAMGIPREKINELTRSIIGELLMPDITVYIDLPAEEAIKRIYGRNKDVVELFEKKEFLEKVRENYLTLAEEFNFIVVDGTQTPEKIHKEIRELLEEYFPPQSSAP